MSFSSYTTQSVEALFTHYTTSPDGLTHRVVVEREKHHGKNEITAVRVHWWQIMLRQFNSPFIFLLFGAALLSFIFGERVDGYMILGFVMVNAVLGFLQEYHSAQSLELLKKYVVSQAKVRRDGKELLIPSRDLVPGDIVIAETGDIISADIRLTSCNGLVVNESVLTGESIAVTKDPAKLTTAATEAHQAVNIGFSGTTVTAGRGEGVVIATGAATVMGEITKLTVETHHHSSFEKGITKFSSFILRMIVVILVLLFVVNVILKGGSHLIELILFSIALAVSVVPEALPVVTTIALSKGAVKLAKHKVIVKRLSAIEDLGSIEVLCTDKTGTLTENTLTVSDVYAHDKEQCLFLAATASSFLGDHKRESNNAFDLALWNKLSATDKKRFEGVTKVKELPFSPERRRNSVLIKNHSHCEFIVRGALEVIVPRCHTLATTEKNALEKWVALQGGLGNRVIAVAHKVVREDECDCTDKDEQGLAFVGLIAFHDPIKATAKHAIAESQKLGVRVKILTGDSKEVARNVAEQVGLVKSDGEVTTGEELDSLSDHEAKLALVDRCAVFARVSPEQKYHIIELLQEKYET